MTPEQSQQIRDLCTTKRWVDTNFALQVARDVGAPKVIAILQSQPDEGFQYIPVPDNRILLNENTQLRVEIRRLEEQVDKLKDQIQVTTDRVTRHTYKVGRSVEFASVVNKTSAALYSTESPESSEAN